MFKGLSNTSPSLSLYGANEGSRTFIRGVAAGAGGGVVRSALGRQCPSRGEIGGKINSANRNNLTPWS